jgi:hypothetical protein
MGKLAGIASPKFAFTMNITIPVLINDTINSLIIEEKVSAVLV